MRVGGRRQQKVKFGNDTYGSNFFHGPSPNLLKECYWVQASTTKMHFFCSPQHGSTTCHFFMCGDMFVSQWKRNKMSQTGWNGVVTCINQSPLILHENCEVWWLFCQMTHLVCVCAIFWRTLGRVHTGVFSKTVHTKMMKRREHHNLNICPLNPFLETQDSIHKKRVKVLDAHAAVLKHWTSRGWNTQLKQTWLKRTVSLLKTQKITWNMHGRDARVENTTQKDAHVEQSFFEAKALSKKIGQRLNWAQSKCKFHCFGCCWENKKQSDCHPIHRSHETTQGWWKCCLALVSFVVLLGTAADAFSTVFILFESIFVVTWMCDILWLIVMFESPHPFWFQNVCCCNTLFDLEFSGGSGFSPCIVAYALLCVRWHCHF